MAGFKGFKGGSVFYELLLTKEKFYKGARGYVCLRTGTGPRAWIVLLYRGSCSRIMDHEVALPLRALRRGGGTDVFVTVPPPLCAEVPRGDVSVVSLGDGRCGCRW